MCAGAGVGVAARVGGVFHADVQAGQQLLAAKNDLRLEAALTKLDRFEAILLDDLGYVQQSREEMEVLFTFLAERYERRSVLVSSNLGFSKWDQIFKDPMTTMAAVDRLVHHAIIVEFDGESQRVASPKAKGGGPPPRAPTRRRRRAQRVKRVNETTKHNQQVSRRHGGF